MAKFIERWTERLSVDLDDDVTTLEQGLIAFFVTIATMCAAAPWLIRTIVARS